MSRTPPSAPAQQPLPRQTRFPWRRFAVFLVIFAVVLISTNAFVWATLGHFFGIVRWERWQIPSAVIALGFIPATLLGRDHSGLLLRSLYGLTASALGLLNYAFFAAIGCWILAVPVAMLHLSVSNQIIALACFSIGIATTIFGLLNASWIRITRITVHLDHLPAAWKNRTAALVTDIHLGHIAGPSYLRRVIARLRALNPDIVLVSGDMFDGTTSGIDRLAQPWTEFTAPLGTWFVTGNHDEFEDRRIYLDELARVGVRVLNNERVVIDGLQLLGVHDDEASYADPYRAVLRRMKIDRRMPSILLNHQPTHLRVAMEEGVSLQLSGHTHNGQMWPWSLLVKRIWRQFAYGLNRLGSLQVYTSSGVGAWGPPLRVGTRSEIVLIHFPEGK